MCKLVQLEDESHNSDEDYKPESEAESASDIDEKRRQMNREALCFDPEKKNTNYNGMRVTDEIEVIEINESAAATASYIVGWVIINVYVAIRYGAWMHSKMSSLAKRDSPRMLELARR